LLFFFKSFAILKVFFSFVLLLLKQNLTIRSIFNIKISFLTTLIKKFLLKQNTNT